MFKFSYERFKPYKFYGVGKVLINVVGRVVFRIRIVGRENLPKSAAGVILVSNHIHSIDPAFLIAGTGLKWRFIAKKELFENPITAMLYGHGNAIPVDRGAVDRKAMDFAVEAMKKKEYGYGMAIFPEGQRSRDGIPHEAKSGIAMFARQTKADILPCSLYHDGSLKFRTKYIVRIGKIIPFEELGLGDTPNKRQNQLVGERIMAEITALWKQGSN